MTSSLYNDPTFKLRAAIAAINTTIESIEEFESSSGYIQAHLVDQLLVLKFQIEDEIKAYYVSRKHRAH